MGGKVNKVKRVEVVAVLSSVYGFKMFNLRLFQDLSAAHLVHSAMEVYLSANHTILASK